MRYLSLLLSVAMICMGIYGLAISISDTDRGYWIAALIVGLIWLFADIVSIKKHNNDK